jgi:tetratricopeptide (TPR) repeat protein
LLPGAGFFASSAERRYREGLVAYLEGDRARAGSAFEDVLAADAGSTSAHLLAALSLDLDTDRSRVIRHLEEVVSTDAEFPDKLLEKFLPPGRSELAIDIKITEMISARVPFDRVGATLLLAEAYQQADRLEEAIGLVQQLHEANEQDLAIRLSLADLLFADRQYEDVVEITTGVENTEDAAVGVLHLRAAALTALGYNAPAFDAFKAALAKTAARDTQLLAAVRYDRAVAYESAGQTARARSDYERLFAMDPDYRDVKVRLAALDA